MPRDMKKGNREKRTSFHSYSDSKQKQNHVGDRLPKLVKRSQLPIPKMRLDADVSMNGKAQIGVKMQVKMGLKMNL